MQNPGKVGIGSQSTELPCCQRKGEPSYDFKLARSVCISPCMQYRRRIPGAFCKHWYSIEVKRSISLRSAPHKLFEPLCSSLTSCSPRHSFAAWPALQRINRHICGFQSAEVMVDTGSAICTTAWKAHEERQKKATEAVVCCFKGCHPPATSFSKAALFVVVCLDVWCLRCRRGLSFFHLYFAGLCLQILPADSLLQAYQIRLKALKPPKCWDNNTAALLWTQLLQIYCQCLSFCKSYSLLRCLFWLEIL